tara:strand:- start:278 stop:601 length:324 start_codon:yes stop_codon:yes gene_type:complete
MDKSRSEQMDVVKHVVEKYVNENWESIDGYLTESTINHVIDTGTSILCTKWGIGYRGGSFVEAVVSNNLSQAIGSADSINLRALKLYCQMIYNIGLPEELFKYYKEN